MAQMVQDGTLGTKKHQKTPLKPLKTLFLTLVLKQFTYKKACFSRKIDQKTPLFCLFLLVFGRKNEVFLCIFTINNIIYSNLYTTK
jgi:hypothetical protein